MNIPRLLVGTDDYQLISLKAEYVGYLVSLAQLHIALHPRSLLECSPASWVFLLALPVFPQILDNRK